MRHQQSGLSAARSSCVPPQATSVAAGAYRQNNERWRDVPTRLLDTKSFERHKRMKEFTPSSEAKQKQLLGEESIHGRRKVEVMIA